jgi:predicted nucleic acid-binding protein
MDSRKLPGRALVDSGVVTRSMGDLAPDDATEVCKGFYEAMLAFGREILIAAPTIAEVMRKDGLRALPRTNGIEVVAFDDQAALVLGKTFPMDVIKSLNHSGTSRSYLLYDALIVACGIRHGAECVVTLDPDIFRLCAAVGFSCRAPSDFLTRQGTLVLPDPSATPIPE